MKKYFVELAKGKDWGKVGEVEPAYILIERKPRWLFWRPTLGIIVNMEEAEGLALSQAQSICKRMSRWGCTRVKCLTRGSGSTTSKILFECPQNWYGRTLERLHLQ